MKNKAAFQTIGCLTLCLSLTACEKKFNPADGAPPSAQMVPTGDMSLVTVDRPGLFPVVAAERIDAPAELQVTGAVYPDIAREVPVISLASGRVVDIKARLDDYVKKGQLLLKVQSPDITNAFDVYLKAVNDEQLTNKAYVRAKDLYDHGAISLSMLEQAEDSERDNQADLTAAEEQLQTLGINKHDPHSIVPVYAPISGVIVAQNVTIAAAAGVNFSGSSTAFTIADLSVVWIICDVYENDIPKLQLGQHADIRLNAYPGRVLSGHISDIGPVLDPNIRTAKVRIEVPNPGILKLGMFVTAPSRARRKKPMPSSPPPRYCTCMTATGSLSLPVETNSGALKFTAVACWTATGKRFCRAFSPGSRLFPTFSSSRQRWRPNDQSSRRLCTSKPLPDSGNCDSAFYLGSDLVS
jgi:membrane fusion protein, heavy metal efflux system